jgi:hypothetical protein
LASKASNVILWFKKIENKKKKTFEKKLYMLFDYLTSQRLTEILFQFSTANIMPPHINPACEHHRRGEFSFLEPSDQV